MQIVIRARNYSLTDAIRAHIARRLGFALDRFAARICELYVWVGDVNGHKAGRVDKSCHIIVALRRGRFVLHERASDLYVAVNRIAHRVRAKLAKVERMRSQPKIFRRQKLHTADRQSSVSSS